jgi:nucleotide-binding universal stress UspA family protein
MTAEVNAEHEHRIVVGVDGSPSSKAALAWAIGQAKLTGAVVDAVTAWDYPATYGYAAAVVDVDWEALAAQVLRDAVSEVAPDAAAGAIRQRVSEGNAAQVLLDASAGADLLVVGSRGHGGFVEALLGSVSQHMVHHAAIPVVVIRDTAD